MAGGWRSSVVVFVLAMATMLPGSTARGQEGVSEPQTVVDVLRQMSDDAGVIFFGQVLSVRRVGAGIVEVQFRVDQAVRGCAAGAPYVLREWGGLWAAGSERYRVGQRLLMLLRAPSVGGLSSPVGGLDGAIPVRSGSGAAFVDLRWLGVKVPRVVSYRSEQEHTRLETGTAQSVRAGVRVSAAPIVVLPQGGGAGDASVPEQQASVDTVLGMLTGWERARHVAP